jgi:teichoic acid glycerol-phosphate primase
VLLYAPTYRENQLLDAELKIDLKSMAEQFGEDYVLILKIHPAVKNKISIPAEVSHFAHDFSSYHHLNELLFVTDILITDYSSIPFEYCLLNRPIIFFLYDLEEYEQERGIWEDFIKFLPGPIAYSSSEISTIISQGDFDYQRIRSFSAKWNEYSNGGSSKNVLDQVRDKLM